MQTEIFQYTVTPEEFVDGQLVIFLPSINATLAGSFYYAAGTTTDQQASFAAAGIKALWTDTTVTLIQTALPLTMAVVIEFNYAVAVPTGFDDAINAANLAATNANAAADAANLAATNANTAADAANAAAATITGG